MKTLKILFFLREQETILLGKAILGSFLVLQTIICAVMVFLRPEESVLFTGAIFPPALGFCLVFLGIQNVTGAFEDGVRMGRTRREMVGTVLKLALFQLALAGLFCAALIFLERFVFTQLWALLAGRPGAVLMEEAPGGGNLWQPIFDTGVLRIEDFSLPLWMDPIILLGSSLLGFVVGAFCRRFGGSWALVIWLPIWAGILGRNILEDGAYDSFLTWLPLGLLLLLGIGFVWGMWSLLHAEVRR